MRSERIERQGQLFDTRKEETPDEYREAPAMPARRAAETSAARRKEKADQAKAEAVDPRSEYERFPKVFGPDHHLLEEPLQRMAQHHDSGSFWSESQQERDKVRTEGDATWQSYVGEIGQQAMYHAAMHVGRCLACKLKRDSFRTVIH